MPNVCARLTAATALLLILTAGVAAQRGGPPPGDGRGATTPKSQAAFDITGYWVSLVNEDWRYRITTPPKGDVAGVPLNGAGRQAANAWDPAKDEAAGESCRAYGAAGVMRQPGRLHIEWTGDDALSIETDAGTQTRAVAFRGPRGTSGSWQGLSVASWDRGESAMARGGFFPGAVARGGSLKVVTAGMKAGYLRKNGVPYSADAVMTEYFDRFDLPNGDALLVVSTEVVDPAYLVTPFWTSTHFKKQRDAAGWNPRPCSAR
jgi:hypothetical protein